MDNNFRDIVLDRIAVISKFIGDAGNTLDQTLDQDTQGDVPTLVKSLVNATPYLTHIQELNQLNFESHRNNHQDQSSKISRLTSVPARIGILTEFDSLQSQVMKYKDVTDYLAQQDTIMGMHPAAVMVDNAANGLSQLHNTLNDVFSDNYRFNYLQSMQNDALIESASRKRNARQFNKLIGDFQRHYDATSPNTDLQINRIVNLQNK
jgi:hypothetical protein